MVAQVIPWIDVAGWGFLVAALISLLPTIIIVVLLVMLLRRPSAPPPRRTSAALTVLEERFARGEISREEFEERRAVLRGSL